MAAYDALAAASAIGTNKAIRWSTAAAESGRMTASGPLRAEDA